MVICVINITVDKCIMICCRFAVLTTVAETTLAATLTAVISQQSTASGTSFTSINHFSSHSYIMPV